MRGAPATTPLASANRVGAPAPRFWKTWIGCASRPRLVTGIAPFATTRSGRPSRSRSAHDAPQPESRVPSAEPKSERASTNDAAPAAVRLRNTAWTWLRAFVTKRSLLPSPS